MIGIDFRTVPDSQAVADLYNAFANSNSRRSFQHLPEGRTVYARIDLQDIDGERRFVLDVDFKDPWEQEQDIYELDAIPNNHPGHFDNGTMVEASMEPSVAKAVKDILDAQKKPPKFSSIRKAVNHAIQVVQK
jgi:hypothetical protein